MKSMRLSVGTYTFRISRSDEQILKPL
jgi:hypothetical protein